MNDDTSLLRERANRLMMRLAAAYGANTDTHEGAIRHLGIAALNLSCDADATTVDAASRALPWVTVLGSWEDNDDGVAALADRIERRGLVRHLGAPTVRRYLERRLGGDQSHIRRAPRSPHDTGAIDTLTELAQRDLEMERLLATDVGDQPDWLLDDSGRLATALSAYVDPGHSGIAGALDELLPDWALTSAPGALEVLARFEKRDFEAVPDEFGSLGERARRFENSLATHLFSHALMPALRAALAFAPASDRHAVPPKTVRRYLTRFSVFADDPTLLDLTIALIAMRRRIVDHLRGRLPLVALTPWITYLRGPCAEFAERRGITLREATNYAHYALHLLDICELAASPDIVLDDALRRAVMDVEDELKEFALVGQRTGLSDEQSHLGRYDDSRWRSQGLRTRLADRLARLCGAWRSGHRAGPPGTAPRPDDELYERCLALVTADEANSNLDALANLCGRAQLRGFEGLDGWSPEDMLALIDPVLRSAGHASTIDVTRQFCVDFSGLTSWLADGQSGRRADILHTLLDLEPSATDLHKHTTGLTVSSSEQHLTVRFATTDELDALLTLLTSSSADDPAFAASLRERLLNCLQTEPRSSTSNPKHRAPNPQRPAPGT